MQRATVTGWAFVVAQVVLLVALVVVPGRSDWSTPTAIRIIGAIIMVAGSAVIVAGVFGLGKSVTPSPVPVVYGELTTTGLYRFVRHPIYTGVLAIVVGLTLRSGSVIHLAIAAATVVFFGVKARWEEQQLAEQYPNYEAYAATTPRFIPRLSRN